jgi:hypothetical protein
MALPANGGRRGSCSFRAVTPMIESVNAGVCSID